MAHYKYERLSAQDNDFLEWERDSLPMHGAATQIFEAGPLATADGGVDFATIRAGIESILHRIPRYRQKLAWIPGSSRAIWVDDPTFNLSYHIRHTGLPRPGDDEQLKQLAARLSERPLDRSRPLWEIWVVEGLSSGRFATIGKTHHCMVDGSSGMHLAQNLFSTTPERLIGEPHRYIPRPHPSDAELRRDELLRLALLPWRAGGALLGFVRDSADVAGEIGERLRALGHLARYKFVPTSDTPLNGPVGPHRVLDWLTLPLADLKAIRKSFGCSINDVVLGIVTGAVRDFLLQRQVHPDDLEFRVASPVNVRRPEQAGRAGNRVSTWIVPLPIREADPRKQIEAIHEITRAMKDSHQAAAIEIVEAIHEWLPIDIQSLSTGTQNMYVTNVPGPQLPLYLLGAKLKEIFLHPPLIQNLGLTVAVLSYDGRVCWGFTADYDRVPDIGDFAALVRRSFERLAERAGVGFESQHPIEVRSSAP